MLASDLMDVWDEMDQRAAYQGADPDRMCHSAMTEACKEIVQLRVALENRLSDLEHRIGNLETLLHQTVRAMESMTEVLENLA
jgi:hypothetical protein